MFAFRVRKAETQFILISYSENKPVILHSFLSEEGLMLALVNEEEEQQFSAVCDT